MESCRQQLSAYSAVGCVANFCLSVYLKASKIS